MKRLMIVFYTFTLVFSAMANSESNSTEDKLLGSDLYKSISSEYYQKQKNIDPTDYNNLILNRYDYFSALQANFNDAFTVQYEGIPTLDLQIKLEREKLETLLNSDKLTKKDKEKIYLKMRAISDNLVSFNSSGPLFYFGADYINFKGCEDEDVPVICRLGHLIWTGILVGPITGLTLSGYAAKRHITRRIIEVNDTLRESSKELDIDDSSELLTSNGSNSVTN